MDRCEVVVGSLWVVVDRCGSLWVVVDRCGSLWLVPGFSNYGSCTHVLNHYHASRCQGTAVSLGWQKKGADKR